MINFDGLPLRTARLLLRPYRASDAPAVFAIFSDPKVMQYWSTPPWTGIEQAHTAIARDEQAQAAGEALRLGIQRVADGALVGQCTLFNFHAASRRAEIGYCLASSAWGQGYMAEALGALVDYGFGALGLNRFEADIDPLNAASARSLERMGFAREGLLRQRWIVDGVVSDSALYGLLAQDWAAALDE